MKSLETPTDLSAFPQAKSWEAVTAAVLSTYPEEVRHTARSLVYLISVEPVPESRRILCETPRQLGSMTTVLEVVSENPLKLSIGCYCREFRQRQKCLHVAASLVACQHHVARSTPVGWHLLKLAGAADWHSLITQMQRYVDSRDQIEAHELTDRETRLVWRANLELVNQRTRIEVVPCLQTRTARGEWSKGKKLNLSRLSEIRECQTNEWASRVFLKTAATMHRYDYTYSFDLEFRVFQALIGCPDVLLGNSILSLNIVSATLGLGLADDQGGFRPQATIDGRFPAEFTCLVLTSGGVLALDKPGATLRVAEGDPELLQLIKSLTRSKLTIPAEGRDQLLKVLPQIEAKLPVVVPSQLVDATLEADQRLYLKLTPRHGGMQVELRVRPTPTAFWCVAGEGPAEVTVYEETRRLAVRRSLAAERAAADTLQFELKLEEWPLTGASQWQISGDDNVLDLLSRLKGRPEEDPTVVWAESASPRQVIGELVPSALQVEIKATRDWFGLEGTIEVAGVKVPLSALLAAMTHGRRYVELADGQWVAIADEFRERLESLNDVLHRNRNRLMFDATAAPVVSELINAEVVQKAARAWKETLKRLERAEHLDPRPPSTLAAVLRDYQVDGYRWLRRLAEWGVGGCLADDMGLGKTVQTLALLIDRAQSGPALIVAPVSVGFNWIREVERFAPTLRPVLYRDADRDEIVPSLGPGDLLIASYQLVQRDAERFKAVRWGTLVLDEAQFIKNSRTKTAQVICELEADWRVALTGTPLENHLGELWSIFRAVSPGLFGAWERFRERFADPVEKEKNSERRHALSRTIRPFILRRTKAEVLSELPPRTEVILNAELSESERKRYEDARLWAVSHLTGLSADRDNRFAVLAALTRLRQLACHPRLVDEAWQGSSAKLDLLLETIDELREGNHRALVFSQFTQHLSLVREALDARGITYQYLDGQTPEKQRRESVDAFQRGEGALFLISLRAGGTGLNLTAADYVIHLDPWWNPAVEDQASDRAHRIGQSRPVTVYRLVARDTIEEQILALHGEKRTLVSGVLDGSDQAARLSTTELIDLIRNGTSRDEPKRARSGA